MANLLPYAIVAGIAVVFFVVCYILFSGGSSEKEEKKERTATAAPCPNGQARASRPLGMTRRKKDARRSRSSPSGRYGAHSSHF